jgi:hypothetical protein
MIFAGVTIQLLKKITESMHVEFSVGASNAHKCFMDGFAGGIIRLPEK